MTTRTTQRIVTFTRPFRLGESCEQYPAGRYTIETDEELLEDVSFPAYLRRATMMQLIADPRRPGITEVVTIDPQQLEAALAADTPGTPMAEGGKPNSPMAPGSQDGAQPEESLVGPHLTKVEP
ncbi:MAG: hypothetical protein JNN33_01490 [Rhodospirillaceae bacterium]|nr:hypothetical protein [Rhodospirillaceae bacterium]